MPDDLEVLEGWGNPTAERGEQSWAWLHVPARSALRVAILSRSPVRYRGHWVDGRMRPCGREGCLYCERRLGGQWRYAFAVLDLDAKCTGLLELGAATAEQIKSTADAGGFLRGLVFELRKEGGRDRGRIMAKSQNAIINIGELPDEPDPGEHLLRAWGGGFEDVLAARSAAARMFADR